MKNWKQIERSAFSAKFGKALHNRRYPNGQSMRRKALKPIIHQEIQLKTIMRNTSLIGTAGMKKDSSDQLAPTTEKSWRPPSLSVGRGGGTPVSEKKSVILIRGPRKSFDQQFHPLKFNTPKWKHFSTREVFRILKHLIQNWTWAEITSGLCK